MNRVAQLTPHAPIARTHTGNWRPGRSPRLSAQPYPAANSTIGDADHSAIPATKRSHLGMFGIAEDTEASHLSSAGNAVRPMRVKPPDSSMNTPVSDASGDLPDKITTSQKEKGTAQHSHTPTIPQETPSSSLLCLPRAMGLIIVARTYRDAGSCAYRLQICSSNDRLVNTWPQRPQIPL